MQSKKVFAYGAAGLLMAGMAVMPVSAHGHHGQTVAAKEAVCAMCTVEGCTETGYHIHDGQTYCGYDHECGYCDGSCGNSCVNGDGQSKGRGTGKCSGRSGGHHGRHHL